MKKIAALTLVLVMVLALCACGGSGGDKGPVGTWEIKSMSNGTETRTVDEVPAMKGYIVIEIKEGGTGTITSGGEVNDLIWDSNTLTVQGDPAKYTVSGDTMTVSSDEYTFVFVRR